MTKRHGGARLPGCRVPPERSGLCPGLPLLPSISLPCLGNIDAGGGKKPRLLATADDQPPRKVGVYKFNLPRLPQNLGGFDAKHSKRARLRIPSVLIG